ncbi:MAG: hypothetical protein QNJ90_12190 [Planctomycetota bacterium]|nr:hypothetical protein [Planctomycetota bacterium]
MSRGRIRSATLVIAGVGVLAWLLTGPPWGDGPATEEPQTVRDGDVASGLGARGEPQSVPSEPGPGPETPTPAKADRIAGIVLRADGGAPAGAGVEVVVVERWRPDRRWRAVTDAAGRFICVLTVEAEAAAPDAVLIQAYDREQLGCTYARPLHRTVEGWPGALLLLREAAALQVRAVDETGDPVPRAEVLISERGVRGGNSTADARRIFDRIVRADANGVVRAIVRAGSVELRAARPGGPRGSAKAIALEAGEHGDAGDVACGSTALAFVLAAVDAKSGEPLAGVWVRLSDRTLRLGRSDTNRTWHLRTGPDGTVRLPTLARKVLPVTIGLGSTTHRYTRTTIPRGAEAGPLRVSLTRRPSAILELAPEATGPPLDLDDVRWTAQRLGDDEGARRPRRRKLDAAEILAEIFGEEHFEPLAGGRQRLSVARAGTYAVRARVPGFGDVSAKIEVTEDRVRAYPLSLPAGRMVTLRLRSPKPPWDGTPWRPVLRGLYVAWGQTRKERHTWDLLAQPSIQCWLPSPVMALEVASPLQPGAPLRPFVAAFGSASGEVCVVPLTELIDAGYGWLEVQLAGPDGPLDVAGIRLRVRARAVDPVTGRPPTVSILITTDAKGRARVPLRPGSYAITTHARLQRRPMPVLVDVRSDATAQATMPVGRQ